MSNITEPHTVSLRVLRLQIPRYYADKAVDNALPTSELMLPTSFGTCSLGEVFTALVCACNESATSITLSVSIEISTAASRVLLVEKSEQTITPGSLLECKIAHEIKEAGSHALMCSVTYQTTPDAEPRSFRKVFKFQTINPLSVKTKVHSPRSAMAQFLPKQRDTTYLEVQIQNISQCSISFQSITFEPANGLENLDVNIAEDALSLLPPNDIRQYLYIIKPSLPSTMDKAISLGTLNLGKLNIVWQSTMGEIGRLTTASLTRKVNLPPLLSSSGLPSTDAIRYDLTLLNQPKSVEAQEPFDLHFALQLKPTRALDESYNSVKLVVQHVELSKKPQVEVDLASALGKSSQMTSEGTSLSADATPTPVEATLSRSQPLFPAPAPFSKLTSSPDLLQSASSLIYLGKPLIHLSPLEIPASWRTTSTNQARGFSMVSEATTTQSQQEQEDEDGAEEMEPLRFSMRYCLLQPGIASIGGIRIMAVEADQSVRRVLEHEIIAQVYVKA